MIVDVAFLPATIGPLRGRACLVVDLLRASNSMIAMLEAGATQVLLAESPDAALAAARNDPWKYWLCGETDGERPDGFDFGNSPAELSHASLADRPVLYCTSNGTRALKSLAASPLVLVAALANASAAVDAALDALHGQHLERITIVCSGDEGGTTISVEDVFCAGLLVHYLEQKPLKRSLAEEQAAARVDTLALDESAHVARRLMLSYSPDGRPTPEEVERVFQDSRNGRYQRSRGRYGDLQFAAQLDVTRCVPRLARVPDGLAIVRN